MNNVIFKGKGNCVSIMLNAEVEFDELKEEFSQKLAGSQKFFANSSTPIEFIGRELSDAQEVELLDIISANQISITFIKTQMPDANNTRDTLHKGSLRSGQFIHCNGNVIVLGDVNPGAEIIASGNVVIMGNLKGLVHAGCKGDTSVVVTALSMSPVQLRIANVITCFPENESINKSSYAYIKDEKLYISPLQ